MCGVTTTDRYGTTAANCDDILVLLLLLIPHTAAYTHAGATRFAVLLLQRELSYPDRHGSGNDEIERDRWKLPTIEQQKHM